MSLCKDKTLGELVEALVASGPKDEEGDG